MWWIAPVVFPPEQTISVCVWGGSFERCFRDSTSASLVMSLVSRMHEAYGYSQTKDFTLFSAVFGFFCFLAEMNWTVNQVSRKM